MKRWKSQLTEMPHIDYAGDMFDLEMETFKKGSDFIYYLEDILDGKIKKDKYGNVIKLKTRKDKIEFVKSLKDSPVFISFVNYKLTPDEEKILNKILKV